jgi:nucleoside-triphosphatase
MEQVYLLTGRPGTGKTSLIKQVVAKMGNRAGGFYTEEIRSCSLRLGFRLVTLDGEETVLAHTSIHSPHRVSRYGVDIDSLDIVGVSALSKAAAERPLIIIDEIGRMELFSANFREVVLRVISSGKKVLGTIMLSPHPWADLIKQKPEVKLIELTRANHPQVLKELSSWLDADLGSN